MQSRRAADRQAGEERLGGEGRGHRRRVRRHDAAADDAGEAVGAEAGRSRDRAGDRAGADHAGAERDRADEGEVRHRAREARSRARATPCRGSRTSRPSWRSPTPSRGCRRSRPRSRRTTTASRGRAVGKQRKREKAQFDLERASAASTALQLRAPAAGMVNVLTELPRRRHVGRQQVEFREGDRAWPGAAIIELPDLSSIHLEARLDEVGPRPAEGRPGRRSSGSKRCPGRSSRRRSTSSRCWRGWISRRAGRRRGISISGWCSTRSIRGSVPGMSAVARIAADRVPNVDARPVRGDLPAGRPPGRLQARRQRVRRAAGRDRAPRPRAGDRRVRRRSRRQAGDPPSRRPR